MLLNNNKEKQNKIIKNANNYSNNQLLNNKYYMGYQDRNLHYNQNYNKSNIFIINKYIE